MFFLYVQGVSILLLYVIGFEIIYRFDEVFDKSTGVLWMKALNFGGKEFVFIGFLWKLISNVRPDL